MTLPTPRPFESFFPKLTPHERCIAEALLAMVEPAHAWTSELTAGHWRLIQEQGRFEAEVALCPDPLLAVYEPRRKRHQPRQRSTAARSARSSLVAFESFDPLKSIPPDVYVEALTGEQVPANGYIRCPLPDHEDRTPSFQVLESHWRCFGCNRGGGIIDLGEYLYRRRRTRVLGAARPRF